MVKLLLCITVLLTSCATDTAYDSTHIDYYSRINEQSHANTGEQPDYVPADRNIGQYFSCMVRYSQYFDQKDSRFICGE